MKEDYIERINKIFVYIEDNLQGDLSLKTISKIAFYSPFHLHRLFKAITNETLNAYIIRKRIERAAMHLIHNRELTISEIAIQTGFTSNSSFTRTFSKLYGQSPTHFRNTHPNRFSKICKIDSKNRKVNFITEEYLSNIINLKSWINMNAKVEIKEMPKRKVAYITQIGKDGLEATFERIIKWARPRGLFTGSGSNVVRIFHDSFKVTDADKVRMSIGVVVNNPVKAEGEVGLTTIEKGKHVVGHFEIEPKEFEKSWDGLFIWMNDKGYRKAERFPFEVYYNHYNNHHQKKCIVDFCIPVE